METLLRKYLSLVDLAVVALCAIFAARATATAIEAGFVSGIPSASARAEAAGRADARRPSTRSRSRRS